MLLYGLISLLAAGTLTAQAPTGATVRLQVMTRGPVVVRGWAGDQVTYKLAERASVGTRVTGDLTRLVVTPAPGAIARLEVNVPRQVVAVAIQTELGGIDVNNLEGSLEAVTGGGEIRLGRIGGAVRCISGGGSIHVDSAGADANCQTAGGDVVVREAK